MEPNQTAFVVLDGQNDFLSKGGVLNEAIEASSPNLPSKLNAWIARARSRGMPVINTHIVFDEGYPQAGERPYGIFAAVKETGGFLRNTWGAEPAEALELQPTDFAFEKPGMSAFLNPDFEKTLKERGIRTLILSGLLTDACVECTMRAAYDKGFEVYVAEDATATLDSTKHEATVGQSYPMFSKPLAIEDL